jgi:aminopeptidase YwaD
MKKAFLACFILLTAGANAQDMIYARKIIDTLTSSYFWGRGYTNDGMQKAAAFIAGEMKQHGLLPVPGKDFLQSFTYPANTFPGDMEVEINGKKLVPGVDFIVLPESKAVKGKGELVQKDSVTFIDVKHRVIVSLEDKLTWSVAPEVADYTGVQLLKKNFPDKPSTIRIEIDNKMVSSFKAANVCGMIKGTVKPDSVIVFTAHYDHLGGMGDATFFPGANDNASGISMLLNLAKYYAANPQPYTMAFIAFAGEEAGLVGSKYYAENPLFPLKRIRFLLNVDLVGTGDEGITVVNATEFKNEFDALVDLNKESGLLAAVNARGKAANSDHYWFTEKAVPSFFIYTLGGIKAYHDVYDKSVTLPLTDYADLFQLIIRFNKKLL